MGATSRPGVIATMEPLADRSSGSGVQYSDVDTDVGVIELVNEPTCSFGSADNVRSYRFARNLAEDSRPSSIHGVALDGEQCA
jgi:hypothetical protein